MSKGMHWWDMRIGRLLSYVWDAACAVSDVPGVWLSVFPLRHLLLKMWP
jgi:hypothetical protein